ncbi:MAG: hypothetical protein HYZ49_11695 [Chloroflexi bacterium]|nr:hypothetical protein [Chloroflexota bacterium]
MANRHDSGRRFGQCCSAALVIEAGLGASASADSQGGFAGGRGGQSTLYQCGS